MINWILLGTVYVYLGYCSGVALCRQYKGDKLSRAAIRVAMLIHIFIWPFFVLASLPVVLFELIYKDYR